MKLSTRIAGVIAGGLLAMAASGALALWLMRGAVQSYRNDVMSAQAQAQAAAGVRHHFHTQVQEWKNTLLRGADAAQRERYWKGFQRSEAAAAAQARQLLQGLGAGPARDELQRFIDAHAAMATAYRKGYESFVGAGSNPAMGDSSVRGIDRPATEALGKLIERVGQDAEAAAAAADAVATRALAIGGALMLAASLAALATAWPLLRRALRPLDDAVEVARRVAGGDLAVPVAVSGDEEIAALGHALGAMQDALGGVVDSVRRNAESVSAASAQIAHGNQDLSARTEQQASALQQTAATMEQIGASVRHNGERLQQADAEARSVSAAATEGGALVDQVVQTMRGIGESSRRIADIIGVIDGIAFRTNLLALNAAVEAARAGEQGRGFAVVASEVRTLAQRAADAAREIRGLIGEGVERAGQGSAQVESAGLKMAEIVEATRRVSALVAEVASSGREQAGGVQQLGQALGQIDAGTQQNAALVEQSAAAADSLRQQAERLVDAVRVFRLADAASARA